MDSDTVEILFGFTDFNKFKKLVLEIKSGNIEVKGDFDTSKSNVGKIGSQFFWDLYNEDVANKNLGWKKSLEHDGPIKFISWRRPQTDGGDIISRSEILYKNIKFETMEYFFKNFTKYHEKQGHVLEEKFMEPDQNGMPQLIYARFKMPMMSERDNLIRLKMEKF